MPDVTLGPLCAPVPDVRRIAVLRGGGLGDLFFAMPAIESLALAYPDAEITLVGTALHRDLLANRPGPVSEVLVLPSPESEGEFFASLPPFDLAVQLHGGGRWSNPFLRRLGARCTVGPNTSDAVALDRPVPFTYFQNETMRWLEVAGFAGAPVAALEPSLAVTEADLTEAAAHLSGLPHPVVTVHPGATDPRRRWPHFAELITALGSRAGVVVIGTESEHPLLEGLPARTLTGLSMSGLVGVLASSAVVVANDSGPRHLAHAVGTQTVSIYWMGNVINAGPAGRSRHGVHISWTSRCPVCGTDCTRHDLGRCEHDASLVADVPVAEVLADVLSRLPAP
ncbi:glycosyltransferase family 9 protein [Allokutzneria sp. A3M-2-11 16]|uniref:glycosyltransferase family 9 protein n=1 Tax=Allokutzneria sp. A3M-2-11 16 TaxID=2962043 RepID=UPI0020B74D54|nr:glycosyltransferase family 9 protein [Allokutzneria sp. A3M-2-11 16]MCP3804907.1 glycosyltransferase family 9 protein [Allokutzneria sp. A3M-2-11 16]